MPYISIQSPSGSRLGPFSVCVTHEHDVTWTKDVTSLATFDVREDAQAFIDALRNLLKLARPTSVDVTL